MRSYVTSAQGVISLHFCPALSFSTVLSLSLFLPPSVRLCFCFSLFRSPSVYLYLFTVEKKKWPSFLFFYFIYGDYQSLDSADRYGGRPTTPYISPAGLHTWTHKHTSDLFDSENMLSWDRLVRSCVRIKHIECRNWDSVGTNWKFIISRPFRLPCQTDAVVSISFTKFQYIIMYVLHVCCVCAVHSLC